jgi:hypothetical protein
LKFKFKIIIRKILDLMMTSWLALNVNSKKTFIKIFTNLTKKGCVIRNYQHCLKSKMLRLENNITLLFIGYISPFKCKVKVMEQHIRFPLLVPRVVYVMINWNWNKDSATELSVNSKCKLSWNIINSYGLNT